VDWQELENLAHLDCQDLQKTNRILIIAVVGQHTANDLMATITELFCETSETTAK